MPSPSGSSQSQENNTQNKEEEGTATNLLPAVSTSAVLQKSVSLPESTPICRGFDFNSILQNNNDSGNNVIVDNKEDDDNHTFLNHIGISSKSSTSAPKKITTTTTTNDNVNTPLPSPSSSSLLDSLMSSYATMGFQATKLSKAIDQINDMRSWRLSDKPYQPGMDDSAYASDEIRKKIRSRIFLGYTSNQISCGQREIIRFLVQHSMVDVIVTTAGGIEEDIIKCLRPTYLGDFRLKGKDLRSKGLNRIGNLIVPNQNYCDFEDWFTPLLTKMYNEQQENNITWTPSKLIHRLGKEINNEESVLYWAYKNNIPIFCPAITDGSIGDMLYFFSYKQSGMIMDIIGDIRRLNDLAIQSHATGMIIIGGGLVKHHICNANLMRNGADWSVFINTASEFDGSDAGADPDEAISWGKIRINANPVKVCAEATLVFPLIVSQTFAKDVEGWKKDTQDCVCWLYDDDDE